MKWCAQKTQPCARDVGKAPKTLPFLQGAASGAEQLAHGHDHRPPLVQPPYPGIGNDLPKVLQCIGVREGLAVFFVCRQGTWEGVGVRCLHESS